ncbi:MAG TPA: DUF2189 domain-containing protein [Phenylobacterium sp.]|uniref:DUF2189 domain-containing protein n=1 Tax=Phenylobacterium sp. TaxID=1871053 RepID=UPI002B497B69|nr:DUF2189 domain-containing protein [Phenylobacterium sp.]HKR90115.1 DUF2189 domain-containing protein [Phenylobacterium sp.]
MPAPNHVENPLEYIFERFSWAATDIRRAVLAPPRLHTAAPPRVRRIALGDLWASLREGLHDLGVARSDVIFIALIYPIAGLVIGRLAFNLNMLPLVLPLLSGFALLGPLAAVGLYEVSRRLEAGQEAHWSTPFEVRKSPALSSILGMGAILGLIFLAWLAAAWGIYAATLGPQPPASLASFLRDVFTTGPGWAMIVIGMGVGFLFAAFTFAISAISFPLLLDRDVSVGEAIRTSMRAVATNPVTMAVWGFIIAAALIAGSIPALAGLIFVMPLFGHASWHLYRRLVDGG